MCYAGLKMLGWGRGVLGIKKITEPFSINGYTNYSVRTKYGGKSFVTCTWVPKSLFKSIENPADSLFYQG